MARAFVLLLSFLIGVSFSAEHGVWIVRNSLNDPSDLRLLETLQKQFALSDVYVQVRALGRNFIPQKRDDNRPDLKEIIRFCRKNNIRFHAWLNVFYIHGLTDPQADKANDPAWQENHIMTDFSGKLLTPTKLKNAGLEGYFVDPQGEENLRQIKELIKKMLVDYRVDGIHLDYFRYPHYPFHYSNFLRAKFLRLFFIDPAKLQHYSNAYSVLQGPAAWQYMAQKYQRFLKNELSKTLQYLTDYIKNINSRCIVSVAVKPNPEQAQKMYAQNWPEWLDRNACDDVILMNYSPDETEFKKNLKRAKSIKRDNRIVIGIGAYYLESDQINRRIQLVKRAGFKGYCLFSFTSFKEKPNLLVKRPLPAVMGIKWKR